MSNLWKALRDVSRDVSPDADPSLDFEPETQPSADESDDAPAGASLPDRDRSPSPSLRPRVTPPEADQTPQSSRPLRANAGLPSMVSRASTAGNGNEAANPSQPALDRRARTLARPRRVATPGSTSAPTPAGTGAEPIRRVVRPAGPLGVTGLQDPVAAADPPAVQPATRPAADILRPIPTSGTKRVNGATYPASPAWGGIHLPARAEPVVAPRSDDVEPLAPDATAAGPLTPKLTPRPPTPKPPASSPVAKLPAALLPFAAPIGSPAGAVGLDLLPSRMSSDGWKPSDDDVIPADRKRQGNRIRLRVRLTR